MAGYLTSGPSLSLCAHRNTLSASDSRPKSRRAKRDFISVVKVRTRATFQRGLVMQASRIFRTLADGGGFTDGRFGELDGILTFLRSAERLKDTLRSSHTSSGRPESVAEHTWRLCPMAVLLRHEFPAVDFSKLIRICVVHDLERPSPATSPPSIRRRRPRRPPKGGSTYSTFSPRCRAGSERSWCRFEG